MRSRKSRLSPNSQSPPASTSVSLPVPARIWGIREWFLLAALTGATIIAYSPVFSCDFVNLDDRLYVSKNPHVLAGLNMASFVWAWTTMHATNWHPLTWLSLMLDAKLFGMDAWGYHLTNLLFHVANTLMLFVLLRRWTAAPWRSAIVAGLFAVHPLHVESVAWISERKDVLSTLFGLLALLAYTRYIETPNFARYLLVVLCMALSLLAKPMLVTLPALLLLLDWWPLRRWQPSGTVLRAERMPPPAPVSLRRLLLEKLPLLALSAASCVVTVWAQKSGGAMSSLELLPLPARLGNALVSYVQYLRQMVIPVDLAPFYPYPREGIGWALVIGASILLAGVTTLVLWAGRRRPYLAVGWLWYLGMLMPVIGLVQVGAQARADRYTYIPLVGIFLLVVWSLDELAKRWRLERAAACLAGAVLAYLMLTSWTQAQYWKNSLVLWDYTLRVAGSSSTAHASMGDALLERGDVSRGDVSGAIQHCRDALRIDPEFVWAHNTLGLALVNQGQVETAAMHFQEALRIDPDHAVTHNNMGVLLMNCGRLDEALRHFEHVLRVDPFFATAHDNLGLALVRQSRFPDAIAQFQESIRLNPGNARPYYHLGLVFQREDQWPEAVASFRAAIRLQPDDAKYHRALAFALHQQGEINEARTEYQESLRLDPIWPQGILRRAWSLATSPDKHQRDGAQAVREAEQVRQAVGERDPRVLDALAAARAEAGQFREAVAAARQAQALASAAGQTDLAGEIVERLRLYEKNQPFRAAVP